MSIRTYLPKLIAITKLICVYTARYDQQIRENLPEGAIPAYDALRAACDVFLAVTAGLIEPNP